MSYIKLVKNSDENSAAQALYQQEDLGFILA